MSVIEVSDELAAALKAKVASQGLTLEDWFQRLAGAEASTSQPPRKSRYSLSDLMVQCDANAPLSDADRAWMDDAPAVGREAH